MTSPAFFSIEYNIEGELSEPERLALCERIRTAMRSRVRYDELARDSRDAAYYPESPGEV